MPRNNLRRARAGDQATASSLRQNPVEVAVEPTSREDKLSSFWEVVQFLVTVSCGLFLHLKLVNLTLIGQEAPHEPTTASSIFAGSILVFLAFIKIEIPPFCVSKRPHLILNIIFGMLMTFSITNIALACGWYPCSNLLKSLCDIISNYITIHAQYIPYSRTLRPWFKHKAYDQLRMTIAIGTFMHVLNLLHFWLAIIRLLFGEEVLNQIRDPRIQINEIQVIDAPDESRVYMNVSLPISRPRVRPLVSTRANQPRGRQQMRSPPRPQPLIAAPQAPSSRRRRRTPSVVRRVPRTA